MFFELIDKMEDYEKENNRLRKEFLEEARKKKRKKLEKKMEKKFNLSKEIFDAHITIIVENPISISECSLIKALKVKEFIKEEFGILMEHNVGRITFKEMLEKREKLIGDKLTK